MPLRERGAYAFTSARRAVWRYAEREKRQKQDAIPFDALPPASLVSLAVPDASSLTASPPLPTQAGNLLIESAADPRLAEALEALSLADRTLLDLCYACEFTDAEAARYLDLTGSVVKTRRTRALARLRRALAAASAWLTLFLPLSLESCGTFL